MRWLHHLMGLEGFDAFDLEGIDPSSLTDLQRTVLGIEGNKVLFALSGSSIGIPMQMAAARFERFCLTENVFSE